MPARSSDIQSWIYLYEKITIYFLWIAITSANSQFAYMQ